jgi:hypothetical protein
MRASSLAVRCEAASLGEAIFMGVIPFSVSVRELADTRILDRFEIPCKNFRKLLYSFLM